MTEPSKAAMERVDTLLSVAGYDEDAFDLQTNVRAFARYIDTVDRVAREAFQLITDAKLDGGAVAEGLHTLMLPDEPDAKTVLRQIMRKMNQHQVILTSDKMAQHIESHLAAAGYTITKEPTRED